MGSEKDDKVAEFENALRRLGWLSAYSRQVLLCRHLLRNFVAISDPGEILPHVPGEFALDLFRVAITVFTGLNKNRRIFSSGYSPEDRPETHHLAYKKKRKVFSASIASGMPEVTFYHGVENEFGFENSNGTSLEDQLLAREIFEVSKGAKLSNRELAESRALPPFKISGSDLTFV